MITNEELELIWQVYRKSTISGIREAENFVIYKKPKKFDWLADKFAIFAEGYLAGKRREKDEKTND